MSNFFGKKQQAQSEFLGSKGIRILWALLISASMLK
jgi:hypothetical protein